MVVQGIDIDFGRAFRTGVQCRSRIVAKNVAVKNFTARINLLFIQIFQSARRAGNLMRQRVTVTRCGHRCGRMPYDLGDRRDIPSIRKQLGRCRVATVV